MHIIRLLGLQCEQCYQLQQVHMLAKARMATTTHHQWQRVMCIMPENITIENILVVCFRITIDIYDLPQFIHLRVKTSHWLLAHAWKNLPTKVSTYIDFSPVCCCIHFDDAVPRLL